MIDMSSFIPDNSGDIPMKLKSTTNFDFDPPSKTTVSPPPSSKKISEVDIGSFFQNEDIKLEDIDSETAMCILNLLIAKLLLDSEIAGNAFSVEMCLSNSTGTEDCDNQDSPLSPKKINYTRPQILDTSEEEPQECVPPEQNSALIKGFCLKSAPRLTFTQYIERINQYCDLSAGVYLATAFYIQKITMEMGLVSLNELNVHRFVIAALRVSCKTIEDINHKQPFIAKIGGVNLNDLQFLEISFLFLIKFECHVDSSALLDTVLKIREIYRDSQS